jgi:HK97 family phage major capsid protein
MYGTGTDPEPRGVKNTSGILTASMGANGAALTNYDPLVDAVGTLRDNNESPTAAIYSPRTGRGLGKLKDTTNQPLTVPSYLDGVPRYETNQVPNNLTQGSSNLASDVFVGDWRQLYVGVRTQLQITVLGERYADTGQVGILAWFRGDIAVARPKAFSVTSGVL